MQRDDPFQLVGQMRPPARLAAGEGIMAEVVGVRQMIDTGQQRAEVLAIA
jgi:hypothetical protein